MSVLHKLKAYFGMVPADDEVDGYEDEPPYRDRYDAEREPYEEDDQLARRRFGGGSPRGSHRGEPYRGEAYRANVEDEPERDYAGTERPRSRRDWNSGTSGVRGALPPEPARDGVSPLRAVTDTGSHYNLSKITTLHPRSYHEARSIGEHYRDGIPVIMNLTDMADADAKRLVDFAAGLAFALRGNIEKVTSKVFLLSPPNIEVAAEDKRRLAEGAFFNYG